MSTSRREGRLAVALRWDVGVHPRVLVGDAVVGRLERRLRLVRVERRLASPGGGPAAPPPGGRPSWCCWPSRPPSRWRRPRGAGSACAWRNLPGGAPLARRSGSEVGRVPHEVPGRRRMAAGRAGGDRVVEEPCRRGHRVARAARRVPAEARPAVAGFPGTRSHRPGRWSIGAGGRIIGGRCRRPPSTACSPCSSPRSRRPGWRRSSPDRRASPGCSSSTTSWPGRSRPRSR